MGEPDREIEQIRAHGDCPQLPEEVDPGGMTHVVVEPACGCTWRVQSNRAALPNLPEIKTRVVRIGNARRWSGNKSIIVAVVSMGVRWNDDPDPRQR
jgi:hypothetical protein